MYVFGAGSLAHQQGLHPNLIAVLNLGIRISAIDWMIAEGVRSDIQCYINFGKGRTVQECARAGCPTKYAQPHLPKVTWINHPLSSNHRKKADGYGHAVDLYPYPLTLLRQPDKLVFPLFDEIADCMFTAAKKLNIGIRWGADWDMDNKPRERGETDNPHFELRG
jgi:peptidoglycan L-alanyl-D-glutamate endopeptidase CwlK